MSYATKLSAAPSVALIVIAFHLAATTEILPADPLAVLTGCSQSSTANSSDCAKAISNAYSPSVGFADAGVCAQTAVPSGSAGHWWQAQISSGPARVTFVRVAQLQGCCNYASYVNLEVTLDGNDCQFYSYFGEPLSPSNQVFFCNRTGQTVRVRQQAAGQLTLCIVQVFTERLSDLQLEHPQLPLENCSRSMIPIAQCELALDGSINQNFASEDSICTFLSPSTWWQAQTPHATVIKYIRIYNQMYCCLDSVFKFTITVDGLQCAAYEGTYFTAGDFLCNATGQSIRITAGESVQIVPLCEVQAFGEMKSKPVVDLGISGKKLLVLTDCSQGSIAPGGCDCGKAIDGSTNQSPTVNCCAVTNGIGGCWWQAKTARESFIKSVVVYNQLGSPSSRYLRVTVDGHNCRQYQADVSFSVIVFKCNQRGRLIRVKSVIGRPLALCEVRALGWLVTKSAGGNSGMT